MENPPVYGGVVATMPAFITQKRVHAARVVDVQFDPGTAFLVLDTNPGTQSVEVGQAWLDKRVPPGSNAIGGYFVVYADGHTSWSPAVAFEESATPEEDYGIPVGQDPKYTTGARGRLVNRETGEAIPDDEAVMIFRARDKRALRGAVQPYRDHVEQVGLGEKVRAGAAAKLYAFATFALHNTDRMKEPT